MGADSISTRSRGFSGRGRNLKRTSRWFGGLFWWTMLIILLALGAVASWTFCIFAFSYPEKPLNYKVLQKFNKLEPLKKFSNSNAPSNRSYEARDLYDRFNEYEGRHFDEINGLLLRNYIENFSRAERGFTMNMVGKFQIEARRELGEKDLFPRGTVLMARCVEFPDVVVEYILPTRPGPSALSGISEEVLKVGDLLDLGTKSRSRFAPFNVVLHISRLEENHYCFCIVPIVFSKAHIARGVELTLQPPERLNPEGVMPPIAVGIKKETEGVDETAPGPGIDPSGDIPEDVE